VRQIADEHGVQPCAIPHDSVAARIAELKADRDRLQRELADTKAQLEACEIWRDKLRAEAAKARSNP
jgi:cell division protein FtsB